MSGVRAEIDARLVLDRGQPFELRSHSERGWRVGADLLQILIDRLGSCEEVVRPLSEQTS